MHWLFNDDSLTRRIKTILSRSYSSTVYGIYKLYIYYIYIYTHTYIYSIYKNIYLSIYLSIYIYIFKNK